MTLQDHVTTNVGELVSIKPAMSPLPYFSGPPGRMPLLLRLICLFAIILAGSEIAALSLWVPMIPHSFKNLEFAFHRGWNPGLAAMLEILLRAGEFAAGIMILTRRVAGRRILQFWIWGTGLWIIYSLTAGLAFGVGGPPNGSHWMIAGGIIYRVQWLAGEAILPVFAYVVLRMPETRCFFEACAAARE